MIVISSFGEMIELDVMIVLFKKKSISGPEKSFNVASVYDISIGDEYFI